MTKARLLFIVVFAVLMAAMALACAHFNFSLSPGGMSDGGYW